MAMWINSHHFAITRVRATVRCTHLQHVHSMLAVESNADNGGESFSDNPYISVPGHLDDLSSARNKRESSKGSDIDFVVVAGGDHRRADPVGISGITYGEVDDAADLAHRRRDAFDLLM